MLMSADSSDCSITKLPITSVVRIQVPSTTSIMPTTIPTSSNNDCSRASLSATAAAVASTTSSPTMSNQQQLNNSRSVVGMQCNQFNQHHQQNLMNVNANSVASSKKYHHSIPQQQQYYSNDTTVVKIKTEPLEDQSSSLPSSSSSVHHFKSNKNLNNSNDGNHEAGNLTIISRKIPHSNVIYVNSSRSRSPTPTSTLTPQQQQQQSHHSNSHNQHNQEQLLLPPPPPPPPLSMPNNNNNNNSGSQLNSQNHLMGPPAITNQHQQHYSDIGHHQHHHSISSQPINNNNRCNSLNNLYSNNNCGNNNNYQNNKITMNNSVKCNVNGNSNIIKTEQRDYNGGYNNIRERSNSLGCIVVSTSGDYNNCNNNNNNINRSLSNSTTSLLNNGSGHYNNNTNNNNNNNNYNLNNNGNQQDLRPQTPDYIKSYPVMDTTVASSIKGEPDLNIEFDGTTVLCRVCGDKASGFHYGVHSCEGCKGFFRRSIQQKIQYRPCTKNQQCSILRINRNRCQYCRLKKCIAVGMSRDAVRFGRVPKREKARILAAMQQSTQNRGQQRQLATELDDQPRLLAAVLRAHMETCEFTKEKVTTMRQRARECPSYSMPTLLACPLNPAPELQSEQEFSERFAHVIRGVIDFAGMIPGFQLLNQDDKFTLLKAGLFDALFVRLICMFDSSINSIICLNGQVMRRDAIQNGANARFLVDSTFNFAERMNSMNLSDAEIGLFCAIVLITPDRPGLRNIELIDKMYSRLKGCLQTIINQNRPDQPEFMAELLKTLPDLRTLSTLHTEKLVVFRTEHKELLRQQMWQMDDDQPAKSPGSSGSNWDDRDRMIDDMAKSPMGSVSSTESGDIGEYSPQHHHHHHHYHGHNHHHHVHQSSLASSAPLLAATLSGTCPLRHRANSGSSAEDIDVVVGSHAHLTQNGLTITPVARSHAATGTTTHLLHHHLSNGGRYRKLDSPTDSGIESGNEKAESTKTVSSGGGSSCSSPRSSVDDALDAEAVAHVTNGHSTTAATTTNSTIQNNNNSNNVSNGGTKRQIVEDMPVLKRVLQAPPLYDTNSLMDEAYKPHKKFRALRHRDYDNSENDPHTTTSTTGNTCSSNGSATSTTTPPTVQITPAGHSTSPSPIGNQQTTTIASSLSSSSSTTVSQNIPSSSPVNQQQSQLHMHLTRNLNTTNNNSSANSSNTNSSNNNNNSNNNYNHHNSNNLSTTTNASSATTVLPQQQQQQQHSSLSSTHSVLAKSLMAEPRMTPEQIKRSDIIQNYIMRGNSSSPNPNGLMIASNNNNNNINSPSQSSHHNHHNHHHHYQSAASPLLIGNAPTSPSTTTVTISSPPPPSHQQLQQPQQQQSPVTAQQQHNPMRWPGQSVITTTTLRQQSVSPHSNSSSCSNGSTTNSSYFQSPHSTSVSPPRPSPSATNSPHLVELQVDIADSQQPLNLSKKSPTPPPRPPSSSSQLTAVSTGSVQKVVAATLVSHKYPSVSPDVTVTATTSNCPPQVTVSPAPSPATTTIHKVLLEA